MRTVASFRDVYEAHIAKGRLETEGIGATIIDEYMVGIDWTYSQAIGGVKVQVPEADFDLAIQILSLDQSTIDSSIPDTVSPEESFEDICPECGSSSVSPQPYSLWTLASSLVSLFLFGLPVFSGRKKWVCNGCGSSW